MFSITLPSSCKRSHSSFSNDGESTITFNGDHSENESAQSPNLSWDQNRQRNSSVRFLSGEGDNLLNHERKRGLPKTPYPTTREEESRLCSFFKH
ncbi:hypothetical protein BX616_006460 [Lobosporangium transversale]|nr:hypothetical protein BX616_006460 [Lobosporangium transversale]